MRNLKVRTKLFAGFGIVLALIVIIAASVLATSLSNIGNVTSLVASSEFQHKANTLSDTLASARLNARTIYTRIDDDSYNAASASISECMRIIADMNNDVKSIPDSEEAAVHLQDAEKAISSWNTLMNSVQNSNNIKKEQLQISAEAAAALSDSGDSVNQNQLNILTREAGEDVTYDNKLRRVERIKLGGSIAVEVERIKNDFAVMFDSFDIDVYDSAYARADALLVILNDFIDTSANQTTRDSAIVTRDALVYYLEQALAFHDTLIDSQNTVASAIAAGDNAVAMINELMEHLNETIDIEADSTLNSSRFALTIVLILAIAGFICAIFIAFILGRGISNPIVKMAVAANEIALGKTNVDVSYESKDEMGQLSQAFSKLIGGIKNEVAIMERLSQNDLTVDVELRSEHDVMGIALKKMVGNLNDMFSDIGASTVQVATGAKQIADGSQALAQGSTEQAAAVEQLSSSISEISNQTKDNSSMAVKAATLANTIKGNAETGSRQMNEMMAAVKEINEASQSINKVIKVIDDIAFQTNILALNAAVEAARAGQHGKGFAVVAEEVRNLAAKSAEAAKDTGSLIANSIEKAELGSRIADETAASLSEIVSGINESSKIVTDIAKSSEEQSLAITQINKGIDQVAQVVQQNSATAEESAAASEEMSGQSQMLEQLIAQFKLKNSEPMLSANNTPRKKTLSLPQKNSAASEYDEDFGKY